MRKERKWVGTYLQESLRRRYCQYVKSTAFSKMGGGTAKGDTKGKGWRREKGKKFSKRQSSRWLFKTGRQFPVAMPTFMGVANDRDFLGVVAQWPSWGRRIHS